MNPGFKSCQNTVQPLMVSEMKYENQEPKLLKSLT